MEIPYSIQEFSFGRQQLLLAVPDAAAVKEKYQLEKTGNAGTIFPFWAKLWPSSLALCTYLEADPGIIKDKVVAELAAGLGLPSMLAAKYAAKVICSDYVEEALDAINRSATLNNAGNIECRLIDWEHYPPSLEADVVLLSDINYDPAQFGILRQLMLALLERGTIIVLSTPQRIMGKPFIESLLPYCRAKTTCHVKNNGEEAEIFIMRLEKGH